MAKLTVSMPAIHKKTPVTKYVPHAISYDISCPLGAQNRPAGRRARPETGMARGNRPPRQQFPAPLQTVHKSNAEEQRLLSTLMPLYVAGALDLRAAGCVFRFRPILETH